MSEFSLRQVLPREQIKINVEVNTWQEAVREAGLLLQQAKAVKPEYIDAMIETAEELGPYIVVDKGIALPHASSDSGVLTTALSLVKLKTPIEFGNPDNDPVTLVFGLAAISGELHVKAMQSLAKLIMDKEKISKIFNAITIDEIDEAFAY